LESNDEGWSSGPSRVQEQAIVAVTQRGGQREYRLNGSLLRDVLVDGQWLTVNVLPLHL